MKAPLLHTVITGQLHPSGMQGMSWIPYFWATLFGCHVSASKKGTLLNKHLTVAVESNPPFIVINKDINGKEKVDGLILEFLEYLQSARNCTFTYVRPHDGLWGYCNDRNNCTGMLGLVNRKEADFALGLVTA